jgi:energy-coupling factor transporter ATP-binding protein EcfA2
MAEADWSNLIVEVLHNRGDDTHPNWSVGSGFFIGPKLVLTALHNVDGPGELLVRVHGTEEYLAVVLLLGEEDIVDLAVLEVSDAGVDVPPLRYGAVDRSTPTVLKGCWAVGFPRFKERVHHPKPLRLSAQVNGEIPTGENLDQPLLTLQVRRSPRPLPSSAVHESEWAGMSGAMVFSGNNIIVGVITEHHLPEGESALTVVPITALDLLPEAEATKWWKLLGKEKLIRLGSRRSVQNTASSASLDDKNRAFMLQRLKHNYHELLEQSLQGAVRLELGFASKPDAVRNTVTLLFRQSNQPERLFPHGTSIWQVYQEEANEELLILGEPGCGKSTQLYALALYLVQQAENDQGRPLPVVFSLSSWATKQLPLEKWMEEQLSSPLYDVSRRISRQWVQNEQVLPLLDGLDEMDETIRPSCIAQINTYHHNHLQPLVVCSRSAEYAAAPEHLNLQSAVVVLPLDRAQVETTLTQGGEALTALRAIYERNTALQELATTPLMLNLLILTYQGMQVRQLPTREDVLQQQLLASYVQRMIESKGRYPYQQTYSWLHWLARQMRLHQQTVFILEQLQPNWLPQQIRTHYHKSIRMIGAPLFGLIGALTLAVIGIPTGMFFGALIYRSINGVIGGLLGAVIGGLLLGLMGWLVFGQGGTIKLAEKLAWSWKEARRGLFVGLPIGLLSSSYGVLVGGFLRGSSGILVSALFGGVLCGLFIGGIFFQLRDGLQLFQHEGYLRSLKKGLFIGMLIGGLVGPLIGLLEMLFMGLALIEGLLFGLLSGLAGGVVGGVVVGFSNTQIKERIQPSLQQEYHRSVRNRLLFGSITGVLFGLPFELVLGVVLDQAGRGGLFKGLLFALIGGLSAGLIGGVLSGFSTSRRLYNHSRILPHEGYRRSMRYALISGGIVALVAGLTVGITGELVLGTGVGLPFGIGEGLALGLGFGALFGLSAVIQHDTLRFWLWHAKLFPWNMVNFLEDARARHLLLRVGGSYSFTHQLLLNYFADLDLEPIPAPTLQPVATQVNQFTPPSLSE